MFLTYAYEIEGPAITIRGTLQVEFNYCEGYHGKLFYVACEAEGRRQSTPEAMLSDRPW